MSEYLFDHREGPDQDSSQAARLGRTVLAMAQLDAQLNPRNNDPLAPVLQEMSPERLYAEFVTDIGERSENEHSHERFHYRLVGGDLISDTGLSMRAMLERGLAAAYKDAERSPDYNYTVLRHQVQLRHLDMLVDYHRTGWPNCLWLASLCPSSAELPAALARKNGFKPKRQMSSNWIFQPTPDGYILEIFTLDNHDLASQRMICEQFSLDDAMPSTTEELMSPKTLSFTDSAQAVEAIRSAHDVGLMSREPGRRYYFGIQTYSQSNAEAGELVKAKPEVFALWLSVRKHLADSLNIGAVTQELSELTGLLSSAFSAHDIPKALVMRSGQPLSAEQGRELMEYLRRRAIPHYVFSLPGRAVSYSAGLTHRPAAYIGSGGSFQGIAAAGAEAVRQGKSYDGACPASGVVTPTTARGEAAALGGKALGGAQLVAELSRGKGEGVCLACKKKGRLYGCGDNGTFCKDCNEVWCQEYKDNQRQLSVKEVARRSGSREDKAPGFIESLIDYCFRTMEEERLKKEENLAEAA